MNSHEAKKLNLPEIMSRFGYQPTSIKKGGNEYWYNSPFRQEKDASFHTSFLGGKWIWNDFGDQGGTVIDFIMRHENFGTVSEALNFLDEMYRTTGGKIKTNSFSFQQQVFSRPDSGHENELEFISATKIQNPRIIAYLTKERGIDRGIALKYLDEIRYKNLNNGREYFAFGIKNRSGGYEIRVASDKYPFKSALIKRDTTLIKGLNQPETVNIFEGMTDFLSLLTLQKTDNLQGDSILMHSLSSYDKTLEVIQANNYKLVNTYLDNNKPGQQHTERFKYDLGNIVSNQSPSFLPFTDINDRLKAERNILPNSDLFQR